MTIEEKIEEMRKGIAPDEAEDDVLKFELESAEGMILNKMYPFGYGEDMPMPSRYDRLQIKLAIELFTHRGADGQIQHQENGVMRIWPAASRILNQVMSHCGSVITNA